MENAFSLIELQSQMLAQQAAAEVLACNEISGRYGLQLTDAEAVFLAGLPNAPSLYASSPELALKRTQTVLKRMVKCRVLTQMQADAIAEEAAGLTV